MYLIVIGWTYVALMMAVVEATSPNGTVLGAMMTFLLYGVGPVALVVYLMGAPLRRRAIRAMEAGAQHQGPLPHGQPGPASGGSGVEPDAGSHAPGHPVAPERKEP